MQQTIELLTQTRNAGKATVYGLEAKLMVLPIAGLKIDVAGAYLHSENDEYLGVDSNRPGIVDIDYRGHRLSIAPRWQGMFRAEYAIQLD